MRGHFIWRTLYILPWLFFALIATQKHTWATSQLLMLMWSGPSRSCTHSRLTTLPSFTVGAVCRRPHILPTVTYLAWRVVDLGSRFKVQSPKSLCRYKSLQAYIKSKKGNNSDTHKHYMVAIYYPAFSLVKVAPGSWPQHLCPEQIPYNFLEVPVPYINIGRKKWK
jgi:hypothetical protein